MDDVLGYQGTRSVVTGAASGMGKATAELLVQLGADVVALDVAPSTVDGVTYIQTDLRDEAAIDVAEPRFLRCWCRHVAGQDGDRRGVGCLHEIGVLSSWH